MSKKQVEFGHDKDDASIALNPPSVKKAGSRSINTTKVIVITMAFMILVMIVIVNRNTAADTATTKSSQLPIPAEQLFRDRVEVEVGTGWYDPNTESRNVRIWGHPKPNVGNGILWRARYNYDDRTIVHMSAIDDPTPKFVQFKGSITSIEYSIEPGQRVKSVPFIFQFSSLN